MAQLKLRHHSMIWKCPLSNPCSATNMLYPIWKIHAHAGAVLTTLFHLPLGNSPASAAS